MGKTAFVTARPVPSIEMKYLALLLIAILGASSTTGLNLDALEKELKTSPLREIDVDLGLSRFSWSFFRKACKCEGVSCECCANPKFFGSKISGCIKFTPKPELKQMGIQLSALNKQVFEYGFSTSRVETICGRLPGKASFLSFCFKSSTTGNEQTGITTCGFFEVNVKTTTAVTVNFRCVELKNGKLSFSENQVPAKNGILNVNAREVFKKVVDFIKKKR